MMTCVPHGSHKLQGKCTGKTRQRASSRSLAATNTVHEHSSHHHDCYRLIPLEPATTTPTLQMQLCNLKNIMQQYCCCMLINLWSPCAACTAAHH
jgi:hypothetical protein